MYPILLTVGPMHVFSLSIFIILAWCTFSFLFWKNLRSFGIEEEPIFDLMFSATIVSFVASRIGYIILHPAQFTDNLLLMLTPWVAPGFSLYGALLGGVVALLYLARLKKVRVGMVLDGLAFAVPSSLAIGEIGALLDGSTVGKVTSLPWGILYAGHLNTRHPVQLYEFLALFTIVLFILFVQKKAKEGKLPYGVIGIWFFIAFSVVMFVLEPFRESHVYWFTLSINQWILVALFAEGIGALYVRGGGREFIRPYGVRLRRVMTNVAKQLYERLPKRHT